MHLLLSYPGKQSNTQSGFLFKITFEYCAIAFHGKNYIVSLMAYLKTRNIDACDKQTLLLRNNRRAKVRNC